MLRGLMVVLALAATAAHAQEAKGGGSTDAATTKGGEESAIMLAARTTPEPTPPPRSTDAAIGSLVRDGPSGRSSLEAALARVIAEAYVRETALAIRTYQAPPPAPKKAHRDGWEQAPYVESVTRCGQFYILKLRSQSKKRWVVDRARLEGPNEELLSVTALRSDERSGGWDINAIVAEAPPGAKLSKLKIHLIGKDDRVAQVEAGDLP